MRCAQIESRGSSRRYVSLRDFRSRFISCQSGGTAIEYGLIAGLIFVAIVSSVQGVATATVDLHVKIQNATGN
jgi:Flp pilus assembly pilin Flp